jgi:putative oxidoreductase
MKIATIIVRILMGLLFVFSGVAFFLMTPPPLEGRMKTFMDGLVASGYFLYFLKLTEFACGLAFLIGRFVPLANVIICPVILNIVLTNAFLMPSGLGMALPLLAGNLFLAYACRKHYTALLTPKINY